MKIPETLRRSLALAAPILRQFPGLVLLVSGYLKAVRPPEEFAAAMESYWVLPVAVVLPLARVVPWLELLTGLALCTGYATRRAAFLAAGLHAVFIALLGQSLVRGLTLKDCGCFGNLGPHLSPVQALALDAVLFLAALAVWTDRENRWSLDRWTERP